MDKLIVKELKKTIDVISLIQLRATELRKDLDFFNQHKDDLLCPIGALMRLEHEVMFLCVDTYSLHQGITKKRSLYSVIIKQNGKSLYKVDNTESVNQDTLINLGVFASGGKREATPEELDAIIKNINKIAIKSRENLKDSTGFQSHEHPEMDDWFNKLLEEETISTLSQYRKEFAHRLDSLENLERALSCYHPDYIDKILVIVTIVLDKYRDILQKILIYTTSEPYEGVVGLIYDSLSRARQWKELFPND